MDEEIPLEEAIFNEVAYIRDSICDGFVALDSRVVELDQCLSAALDHLEGMKAHVQVLGEDYAQATKRWYQKPAGKIAIGTVVFAIFGGCVYYAVKSRALEDRVRELEGPLLSAERFDM